MIKSLHTEVTDTIRWLFTGGVMLRLDDGRKATVGSISKVTNYANYNLFQMEILYDYNLHNVIAEISSYNNSENHGLNDKIVSTAIFKEAAGISGKIDFDSFGCTAFKMADQSGIVRMGRNYDFKNDTSCMLVKCHPKGRHSSIAFAALDNIHANYLESEFEKYACLTAPFICLDGINSAGVSIAVLTLDSEPVFEHENNKSTIATTLAIRAVLDEADSVDHAVEILRRYNMYAVGGRDYHFFLVDSSGECRIAEYIYDISGKRKLEAASVIKTYGRKESLQCTTNFFIHYIDKVAPGKKNGIYGHGKDRYNDVLDTIDKYKGICGNDEAWEALKASSQLPGDDATSNTQWSVVYKNLPATAEAPGFNSSAEIALKRDFRNRWGYDSLNGIKKL